MSKLLIDTLPLSDCPFLANDYTSFFIYSAIMDPLVLCNKKNHIICNAAKSYKYYDDELKYEFCLRTDLRFSNGEIVTAKDYIDAIEFVLNNRCYAKYLYENIAKTEYYGNIIIIYLKHRDLTFLEKLSCFYISPYKNYISSGPYQIEYKSKNKIVLIRNKFYRIALNNKKSKKLYFLLSKNLKGILNKIKNQNYDLTTPTLFPLNKINEYKPIISENNLFFILKFNIKYLNKSYDNFRKTINHCIDRKKIIKVLNNVYTEKTDFLLNDKNSYFKNNKSLFKFQNTKINLGYCNFYPNKIIAEEIKRQLKKYGLNVKLNICDLAKANNNDINLEINYFAGKDLGTFYISKYFKLIHNEKYKELTKEYEETLNINVLKKICKMQKEQSKIIPLFKSKNIYLKSSNLKNFDLNLLNYYDL